MRETKSFLRSAYDAIVDARTREAERTVAYFQRTYNLDASNGGKR